MWGETSGSYNQCNQETRSGDGSMESFQFPMSELCFEWLEDILYNIYSTVNMVKEFWESLEKKYKTEDTGTKKFKWKDSLTTRW